MKENIHPDYHQVTVECACGEKFVTGSTKKGDVIKVEICNKCHPYFTGKQKLVDAGGRVDRFKNATVCKPRKHPRGAEILSVLFVAKNDTLL